MHSLFFVLFIFLIILYWIRCRYSPRTKRPLVWRDEQTIYLFDESCHGLKNDPEHIWVIASPNSSTEFENLDHLHIACVSLVFFIIHFLILHLDWFAVNGMRRQIHSNWLFIYCFHQSNLPIEYLLLCH